jgi:hypothetical protein
MNKRYEWRTFAQMLAISMGSNIDYQLQQSRIAVGMVGWQNRYYKRMYSLAGDVRLQVADTIDQTKVEYRR